MTMGEVVLCTERLPLGHVEGENTNCQSARGSEAGKANEDVVKDDRHEGV